MFYALLQVYENVALLTATAGIAQTVRKNDHLQQMEARHLKNVVPNLTKMPATALTPTTAPPTLIKNR